MTLISFFDIRKQYELPAADARVIFEKLGFRVGNVEGEMMVDTSTGIEQVENSISISPNPTSSFIRLSGIDAKTSFRIFDTSGRLLDTDNASNNGVISVQEYPAGIYILQVVSEKGISTHKFTKN